MFRLVLLAVILNVFIIGQNLVFATNEVKILPVESLAKAVVADSAPGNKTENHITPQPFPSPNVTTVLPPTTKPTPEPNVTSTEPPPITVKPNTTTTTPPPPPPHPPTPPPVTTTSAPNITTTPGTPSTTTTVAPNITTTAIPVTTTLSPHPHTTEKPDHPSDRKFDAFSFLGGFSLGLGLVAIAFLSWKFYMSRQENVYHTL